MALPGAAAARTNVSPDAGYVYTVKYNYCSGGAAYFKVKETARGYTPANGLTIDMYAQEYRGGRWKTVHHFAQQYYYFAANGKTHYLTAWANWYNSTYYVRLKFKLRAWNGGYVVAKKTLYSKRC
jgi:hypothetical protein